VGGNKKKGQKGGGTEKTFLCSDGKTTAPDSPRLREAQSWHQILSLAMLRRASSESQETSGTREEIF